MNDAMKVLLERRSIRKYEPRQITAEELDAVLEAGTYAATARGTQSPIMVVVQDPELVKTLSRMNAEVMNSTADPFYGAPTVVIVFADGENANGVQDASLVMGNLMNAAYAVGLGSCWINRAREMFETEEGKALMAKWGVDSKYVGVANCILGYAAETPQPKARKEGYIIKV